jgi:hypothetical protein
VGAGVGGRPGCADLRRERLTRRPHPSPDGVITHWSWCRGARPGRSCRRSGRGRCPSGDAPTPSRPITPCGPRGHVDPGYYDRAIAELALPGTVEATGPAARPPGSSWSRCRFRRHSVACVSVMASRVADLSTMLLSSGARGDEGLQGDVVDRAGQAAAGEVDQVDGVVAEQRIRAAGALHAWRTQMGSDSGAKRYEAPVRPSFSLVSIACGKVTCVAPPGGWDKAGFGFVLFRGAGFWCAGHKILSPRRSFCFLFDMAGITSASA